MHTFDELRGIVAKLRSEEGCPWDREQTFESLKKCLADETEEVFEAVDNKDMENLCEELGDVLLLGAVKLPRIFDHRHGCRDPLVSAS